MMMMMTMMIRRRTKWKNGRTFVMKAPKDKNYKVM
jgi:hypothetical protein